MSQGKIVLLGLSLLVITSQPAMAVECSAKSGAVTVPLLELYTSEGCSSCPPADKWLSGINTKEVTPLAFHVDYWDYIGWKDKFSKPEYSERQRKTAAFAGAGFVYTPQFVINGSDFKGWDNSRLNEKVALSQKLASRVNLSLNAFTEAKGGINLKASAQALKPADTKNSDVYIALYENKLVTQVKSGENSGRVLKHDYVVRQFFGAYQISNLNEFNKNFILSADWKKRDAGAVIFVQNRLTGEILQSLAIKFCAY